MAKKRAAGTSPGVWLAPCARGAAAVPVGSGAQGPWLSLNFAKMNAHLQPRRCTGCWFKVGDKVRGTKKDTTLSGRERGPATEHPALGRLWRVPDLNEAARARRLNLRKTTHPGYLHKAASWKRWVYQAQPRAQLDHQRELGPPSTWASAPQLVHLHNPECDPVPYGCKNPRVLEESGSLMLMIWGTVFVNKMVFCTLLLFV